MKHLLLILTLFIATLGFSGKPGTLTISYKFTHIEVGYDHLTKCRIYVDDVLAKETAEHKQSNEQSFTLQLPKGNHTIRIMMLAFYEGVWEEHIIANGYSTEAVYSTDIVLKKKSAISLEFDLDQSKPVVKGG